MSIKILLADDHRITREGIRHMLDDEPGLEVVAEAGDGLKAVALAAELAPDVVVMDITMPGLNGVEATRQIRAQHPGTRVLALTMHGERQFVSEVLAAGASGYLLKDCPYEELTRAIRAVASGNAFLSPQVQETVVKGYVSGGNGDGGRAAGRVAGRFAGRFAENLSPREREVLQLVAEGKSTKEIAMLLHLSTKTVETHRRQVMSKLNLDSVADLTRYAIREGITSLI